MNQSQIHPALRQPPQKSLQFSSPPKADSSSFADGGAQPPYSPLQPSPNHSYQSVQTPQYYGANVQSPEEHDGSPAANPSDPNDLKRPRACEACRQLKVKCEFDDNHPTGSCKRCAKANRQCIITAPSRKRQKKTDSRVAELEKKIDALTASLVARGGNVGHEADNLDPAIAQAQIHTQQQQQQPPRRDSAYGDPQSQSQWAPNRPPRSGSMQSPQQANAGMKRKLPHDYDYFGGELQKASTPGFKSPMPTTTAFPQMFKERKGSDENTYVDIIDQNIIDLKTANKCFDRYVSEMCSQLPLVVFPPGTKSEEIRKTKPMLFLAVIAVASGTVRTEIQSKLISEAMRQIADRVVYRGEKSLELVQMIQVVTIFYQPPDRYEELNFNQLIHISAVMALDIGMGKRSKVGAFAIWKEYMDKKTPLPDSNAAETRRCWLGCYYMCAK
jgi:Fungal Zn(2)-Cys(6) binuclear cluster domain